MIRSAYESIGQVLEICLRILPIVLLRLTIYAFGGVVLETIERLPESVYVVDMMPERSELGSFARGSYPPYTRQLALQTYPALSPEPGLLARILLGQSPSLHRTLVVRPFL